MDVRLRIVRRESDQGAGGGQLAQGDWAELPGVTVVVDEQVTLGEAARAALEKLPTTPYGKALASDHLSYFLEVDPAMHAGRESLEVVTSSGVISWGTPWDEVVVEDLLRTIEMGRLGPTATDDASPDATLCLAEVHGIGNSFAADWLMYLHLIPALIQQLEMAADKWSTLQSLREMAQAASRLLDRLRGAQSDLESLADRGGQPALIQQFYGPTIVSGGDVAVQLGVQKSSAEAILASLGYIPDGDGYVDDSAGTPEALANAILQAFAGWRPDEVSPERVVALAAEAVADARDRREGRYPYRVTQKGAVHLPGAVRQYSCRCPKPDCTNEVTFMVLDGELVKMGFSQEKDHLVLPPTVLEAELRRFYRA